VDCWVHCDVALLGVVMYSSGVVGLSVCSDLFTGVVRWVDRELCEFVGADLLFVLDRRRLLTWYGCLGEPLRRYFPVVGFTDWVVVCDDLVCSDLCIVSEALCSYDWLLL